MTPEAQALADFILWARKHRVQVASIKLGDTEVTFTDLALYEQTEKERRDALKPEAPRQSIYEEFGGEIMAPQTPASAQNEPTEEDEDE